VGWNISEEAESSNAAARTFALDRIALSSVQRVRLWRTTQQGSTELQSFGTTAVSEEAEVSDLDKAWWQDVKQKTPHELDGINRHNLLRVVIG
jgi:hypothetical protein